MLNEARAIVHSYEIHTGTTMDDIADDEILSSEELDKSELAHSFETQATNES
jgi:hypothetical protein